MESIKRAFLIDGIGALMTGVLLAGFFPIFPHILGMPLNFLYVLGTLGFVFAAYSLGNYFMAKDFRPLALRRIIVANILYCFFTAFLVWVFASHLTGLGCMYFLGEILIIAGLVVYEVKVIRS